MLHEVNEHRIHNRVNILGVGISPLNLSQAVDRIAGWIVNHEENYVCVTPAHGVMDCQNDVELKRLFNQSGMTTPDGMSIVWLARWMGYSGVDRVYGPDLMRVVCQRSVQEGWRHFLYGGAPGVAEQLADRLRDQFPNLQIVGCYTPPFRLLTEEEDSRVVQYIRSLAPHIVWVGISTPKQERWMAEHLHTLDVPVLIGVGAAFDFLAGVKKQAPRWIQRSGMEWLFRLASEPRRLWKRYAQYPLFGLLVLLQILGIKKYPLE